MTGLASFVQDQSGRKICLLMDRRVNKWRMINSIEDKPFHTGVDLDEAMGFSVCDDMDRIHRVPPSDDSWRLVGSDLSACRPWCRHHGHCVLQLLLDSEDSSYGQSEAHRADEF